MPNLTKPDPATEDLQAHIDHYATSRETSPEDPVEWFMRCQAEIAVEKAGVKARFTRHRAILDAAEKGLLGDLARRRGGLEWKHKEEVIRLVAERLQGKKQRHVKTDHGKVGFRKQGARQTLAVHDEARLAKEHPEFFIKQAPKLDRKGLELALEGGLRMPDVAWLDKTPEYDNFYIDTGKPKELPAAQPALPEKGSEV